MCMVVHRDVDCRIHAPGYKTHHVYGLEKGDHSVLNTKYWHQLTVRRGLEKHLSSKNEDNDTVLSISNVLTMPLRKGSFLSGIISEMEGK